MPQVITVGDMRRLEQRAVDGGTPYRDLMERAGAAATQVFKERYGAAAQHVLILCGNGNNGGDGYVIARRLAPTHRVTVLAVGGEPQTALAKEMAASLDERVTCLAMADWQESCLSSVTHVIDAVYGIGFHGALPSAQRRLFEQINRRGCPLLAVDIPSGMNADSGITDPCTLRAQVTVTFTAPKPCAVIPACRPFLGETVVCSVGIDDALCRSFETSLTVTDDGFVKAHLPRRTADSHKGTYGRLLAVCGSYGMVGAALLAGRASLRMGLGLLHMALPNSVYPLAAGALLEAVYHPLDETEQGTLSDRAFAELDRLTDGKDAVLLGCGLSCEPTTAEAVRRWAPMTELPLVLDADGLNAFSGHILLLKARTAPTVITPHPAEAARLLGVTTAQIERDRFAAAKQLASELQAVVVLKGHRTLIACPDGTVYVNTTGCSGMATGGSGDVLGGMIASLAAQGVPLYAAACCGVYLHGLAGEAASQRLSETAMLPSDMLCDLASLLSHFEQRE